MNEWLHDARESENTPLLMEILRVYHTLPVTIDIMKKNDAAKTIKQLRKSEDEGKSIEILISFSHQYLCKNHVFYICCILCL